jgi:predicted lipid-binding transport protein (Tim44 family)
MPDLNIRETHTVRDESNSNAMTVMAAMFGVLLIVALIGYFAWWQPSHTTTVVQNPNPVVVEKTTTQPTYFPVPMQGAQGPAGPAGSSGPSGASGQEGATGPTGQTGSAGQSGPSGPSGSPGKSGS